MRDVSSWSQFEQHRYHAARFAFAHRSEPCPNQHAHEDGRREAINWEKWFLLKFGLSLDAYQQQIAEREK